MKNLFLLRLLNSLIVLIAMLFLQSTFLISAHAAIVESSSIKRLFVDDNEAVLPPEVAFQLSLNAKDTQNIQANFTIVPGHYLYRERIKFEVQSPADIKISSVDLPTGEIKNDANFGKQEVYHHDFKANIKLSAATNSVTINASYQGCSEKGLCYAPIKKTISVNTLSVNTTTANLAEVENNETDSTTQILKSGNLWLVIASFFVAGLLLSLTPCVLPMIPILSSIIVGSQSQSVKPSKLHAFGLSVAYVLGMALSYTLAGIAAGLSGNLVSQALQNPWVLGTTSFIFVLLALSMFGFYELKLPQSFEVKMLNTSNKLKGGHFVGVFVMGALSALIVSPCVAAPLAGALIYIGQTHNVLLGGAGLFALGLGAGFDDARGDAAAQPQPDVAPQVRHPRTAAGVSEDGHTLILVVVDGRQPGYSVGATLYDLGDLMIRYGADDAINLDGGGSTTFVYQPLAGPAVMNRPSDGRGRAVANALGIWVKR